MSGPTAYDPARSREFAKASTVFVGGLPPLPRSAIPQFLCRAWLTRLAFGRVLFAADLLPIHALPRAHTANRRSPLPRGTALLCGATRMLLRGALRPRRWRRGAAAAAAAAAAA